MTLKQWIDNYWYHYKWHTIIGLALVITLAVGVTQCATKTKYDSNCVLYCDRLIHDNTVVALEEQFEKRITDLDGNGTVAFQVYNLSYDSGGTTVAQSTFGNSQKLLATAGSSDYVLYLVDEYGYDRLAEQGLFETYDFMPDQDHTAWNWKGSALQKSMEGKKLPENLYFCVRKITGNTDASEEAKQRAEYAAFIVQALMSES